MKTKNIFDTVRDSIQKIVSGEETENQFSASETQRRKAIQIEIENALLILIAEIIKVNSNFTSEVENFITAFLEKQFGKTNLRARKKALDSHLFVGPKPFTKMACEVLKMHITYSSKIEILNFLFGVAGADDFVNARELKALRRISDYLDLPEKDFKVVREQFLNSNNPYALLQIEETATSEEIQQAYRKMVLKYHPDKREKSVSEEEASKKFRDIKKAYETIQKAKK